MRSIPWILVVAAAGGLALAAASGSCAIDDEPTWITGATCTGTCSPGESRDYSCDIDSACTETEGCTDWDCDEVLPPIEAGDADADVVLPGGDGDGDLDDVGAGEDDAYGGDTGISTGSCIPFGGELTRELAVPITSGVVLAELRSCPSTSQWFQFEAVRGRRFVVDLRPFAEGRLTFLLYVGDALAPIASAELTGPGTFSADAGVTGTYYIRIRSSGGAPVDYSLQLHWIIPD